MVKKIIYTISIFVILSGLLIGAASFNKPAFSQEPEQENIVVNQEKTLDIYFFYSLTCPHCAKEESFLDELEQQYPQVKVSRYIISNKENIGLLQQFYEQYNAPEQIQGLVPITFIEDKYYLGFDESIKQEIESCALETAQTTVDDQVCEDSEYLITLPLIGKIDMKKYPLPVLTIILGTLDGFNVCSLGALVLILALVLALKSRKRILIFGSIFVLTTAIVYGLLIFLWYQIFHIFSPYQRLLEMIIVLTGILGGTYFLRQFLKYRKYGPTCEMDTGKQIMGKFTSLFKKSIQQSKNIFLIIGLILIFAGVITIVEFPCSAAVPVAFAGMLVTYQLSSLAYLSYIALFVIFYMLDEIIVFLVAFFTMKIWLASNKAIIWITLIEALMLYGLAVYYLFGLNI